MTLRRCQQSDIHAQLFDSERQTTNNVMQFIKNRVGAAVVANWFDGSVIKFSNDGVPTIYFRNQFVHDWVRNHYTSDIEDAFEAVCKTKVFQTTISNGSDRMLERGSISDNSIQLEDAMRFETFVVGKCNEVAFQAANRIATGTASFNPLFIYGQPGVGKTHLIQAIAWKAKEMGKRVCYISAEQYMISFIKALRDRNGLEFKDAFRDIDLFCMEDIQFIDAKKDSTQEEIFHTFVRLTNAKVNIIVSADQKPCDLLGIDDRLKSRLGGGFTAYMYPPSFELRLAILEQKVRQYNKEIEYPILEMLANRVQSNVRELEGALTRICAQMDFFGKELNLESASSALDEMLNTSTKKITFKMIGEAVCEYYKVSMDAMLSTSRIKEVVGARQSTMLLCRQIMKQSLPGIGKMFQMHHTAVFYGIQAITEKMNKDPGLAVAIEKIRLALYK